MTLRAPLVSVNGAVVQAMVPLPKLETAQFVLSEKETERLLACEADAGSPDPLIVTVCPPRGLKPESGLEVKLNGTATGALVLTGTRPAASERLNLE